MGFDTGIYQHLSRLFHEHRESDTIAVSKGPWQWAMTGLGNGLVPNKPLPEPRMTQLTDAYMRHQPSMSQCKCQKQTKSGAYFMCYTVSGASMVGSATLTACTGRWLWLNYTVVATAGLGRLYLRGHPTVRPTGPGRPGWWYGSTGWLQGLPTAPCGIP